MYYDKINLEERIKQGIKSTEINEKYSQIKNFYEKFIDVLNEKLVENTEQNMMIKFKLKELLESTHQNSANISSVQSLLDEEINDDEIARLNKEKKRYEESLSNESKEIEINRTALHKNLKMKSFLKKLLTKFISNTQINECRELQNMYTRLSNEKRELEIKTKKYQEYFNSVLKEKEKKTQEIFQLTNELEKTKLLLQSKDKRIAELESRISKMESKNRNIFSKQFQSPLTKSMLNFIDDCDSRSSSTTKDQRIHHRSTSIKNLSHYSNSNSHTNNFTSNTNNNYISINLNSKIPTITAFIKGDDIYSHDVALANSISNLKYNLTVKSTSKSPKRKSTSKNRSHAYKITPSTSLAKKPGRKDLLSKESLSLANLRSKKKSNGVPTEVLEDKKFYPQNTYNNYKNNNNITTKNGKIYHGYISPIKKVNLDRDNQANTEPSATKNIVCSLNNNKHTNNFHSLDQMLNSRGFHVISTSGLDLDIDDDLNNTTNNDN